LQLRGRAAQLQSSQRVAQRQPRLGRRGERSDCAQSQQHSRALVAAARHILRKQSQRCVQLARRVRQSCAARGAAAHAAAASVQGSAHLQRRQQGQEPKHALELLAQPQDRRVLERPRHAEHKRRAVIRQLAHGSLEPARLAVGDAPLVALCAATR
jgi:hypothetical protein